MLRRIALLLALLALSTCAPAYAQSNVTSVTTSPTAGTACKGGPRMVIARDTGTQWACQDDDSNGTYLWASRGSVLIDNSAACAGIAAPAPPAQCWSNADQAMYCSVDIGTYEWGPCGAGVVPAGSTTEIQYRAGSTTLGATDTTYTAPTLTEPSVTRYTGAVKLLAGWDATGDSQGMQLYPGRRRSAALAVAAKKRGDTKFVGPTSSGVLIIGDSIMAVTSQATWRIWDEKFQSYGLGYDPIADSDIYHSNFVLKTETFSGTWSVKHVGSVAGATAPANAREWGINGSSVVADSADDTLLYSVAAPVRFNRVRIWYAKTPGGGTFEWRANGGSWNAVNTDNATLDAGFPVSGDTDCINLSAGILTQNTVEVRWSSGGLVTLYGIETFSKETGGDRVEFNNVVPYWITAGGQALYGTATSFDSYAHSNVPLQTFIRTTKPSQIIVTLGANDGCYGGIAGGCSNFTTPDNYEAAMRRVITSLDGYWDSANKGDIVIATALPRGTYGSGVEHAAFAARANEYRVRIFEIARDTGVSVWDLRRFWPDFAAQDQAGLNLLEDGTHPGPTGKALLAASLAAWIGNVPWKGERTSGIYCGQYGLSAGAVTWTECTFGDIFSSSGTLHTINSCDQRLNKGRSIEVFCTSTAGWDIDADSTAGNIRAGTDFVCAANKTIRLTCDGSYWRETGRSAPSNKIEKVYLPAAGCSGTTAGPVWDISADGTPQAVCDGANIRKGYLRFDDTATEAAYTHLRLPADWTGALDYSVDWTADSTEANAANLKVAWDLQPVCIGDGEAGDPSWAGTNTQVNDSYAGTTAKLLMHTATSASLTTTGCAAGETMYLRVRRVSSDTTNDTLTGDAWLLGVELTLRRTP